MSISLRTRRALVMAHVDAGTAGEVDTAYQVVTSGDADQAWWCSVSVPTGREVTTGMQPDHRVDAVIGFAEACPVAEDYALLIGADAYVVRAVLPRDYGRDEVQVLAERQMELTLSSA